jgi:hypothetical protein
MKTDLFMKQKTCFDSHITLDDDTEVSVTVHGTYYPAYPATRDYPGDEAEFEIEQVFGYDGLVSEQDWERLREEGFAWNEE